MIKLNFKKVKWACALFLVIIVLICVYIISKSIFSIEHNQEEEKLSANMEAEPLVITTSKPDGDGMITVINKDNEEVFQYCGEFHSYYNDALGQWFITLYLPDAKWSYE